MEISTTVHHQLALSLSNTHILSLSLSPSCLCLQNGMNALHLAAKEGHTIVVAELLKHGAEVNSATNVSA